MRAGRPPNAAIRRPRAALRRRRARARTSARPSRQSCSHPGPEGGVSYRLQTDADRSTVTWLSYASRGPEDVLPPVCGDRVANVPPAGHCRAQRP
jgi:hypothetical protein